MLKNCLWGVVLSLCFQCTTSLSEEEQRQVESALADTLIESTQAWDVQSNLIEHGKTFATIRAPYSESVQTQDDSYTHFKGPVSITIQRSETDSSRQKTYINCKEAVYRSKESTFTFKGNVFVNSNDQRFMLTEELIWFQETKSIQSDQFVTIITLKDTVMGVGLIGDETLDDFTIQQVTGSIEVD